MSKTTIKSDLARLDRMKDSDIDYSDIPPLGDDFFKKAEVVAWPPVKQQLTIRLDADVLDWLKANGRGYQTRINHILRAAMESKPARRARATTAAPKRKVGTRRASRPA
ncbi:MAG: BrnA antitoxin family protein [Candidatus Binataceae bacterium]